MAKQVTGPAGDEWTVRRSVLRGRDGAGRRWRWRAPAWLGDVGRMAMIGDLAEIPVVGVVFLVVGLVLLVVFLALFLPFLVLGLIEAVVLGIVAAAGVVLSTLFGRPLLVRADRAAPPRQLVWALKGWGASRALRDRVVGAIEVGADPVLAVPDAELVRRVDGPAVPDGADDGPPPPPPPPPPPEAPGAPRSSGPIR